MTRLEAIGVPSGPYRPAHLQNSWSTTPARFGAPRNTRSRLILRGLIAVLLVVTALSALPEPKADAAGGYNASSLVGQHSQASTPSFTNGFVQGQIGTSGTTGVAIHNADNLMFVSDDNGSRVLAFRLDPTTKVAEVQPFAVLGQPDFTTTSFGTSATKMYWPMGLVVDETRDLLFVAEYGNGRISVWDIATVTTGEAALYALGKPNLTTSGNTNGAAGMGIVQTPAFDPSTKYLYAPDDTNNRVMVFDTTTLSSGMSALYVLGQPNATTYSTGITSQKMDSPLGAALTSTSLYVTDRDNNRVLVFPLASMATNLAATNVLGQANFTSGGGAVTATGLTTPVHVQIDTARNRAFVSEANSDRVMVYDVATLTNGEAAVNVMGQTDMITGSSDLNAQGFFQPRGMAYHAAADRLYVADYSNNRVLVFNGNVTTNNPTAIDVIGHRGDDTLGNFTSSVAFANEVTAMGMKNPLMSAVDAVNHRLFVADFGNGRVLVHNLDVNNRIVDLRADFVLGQVNFAASSGTLSQTGMSGPMSIAYDSVGNRLFVGDYFGNRVLVFDVASITNGEAATFVLGQANFTATTGARTQAGMNQPWALAYDSANSRLFVADTANHRVLVHNVASITNGQNASFVLGQADFTTASTTVVDNRMNGPNGAAFDSSTNRLFVSDGGNSRVLVFDTSTITNGESATGVLGQANFTTATTTLSATGMDNNVGIALDVAGQRLMVADSDNNRVVLFDVATVTNGEAAQRVFGQPNLTTGSSGLAADSLWNPVMPAYDPTSKQLFVTDRANQRVIQFEVDTTITSTIPTSASNGVFYSSTLAASNPNGTTTYSVTSGTLPPGMSLSSGGVLSGTPTGASGTYNFTVTASTSPAGHGTLTGSKAFSITMTNVAPNPPTGLTQTRTDSSGIPSTTHNNFDASIQGWSNANAALTHETTTTRTGAGALRAYTSNNGNQIYLHDNLYLTRDLSANGPTFSAWARLPAGATGTGWRARIELVGGASGAWVNLATNEWVLLTYSPPPGFTAAMSEIAISLEAGNYNATGVNSVYVDDVQQGNGIWTNETSVRFAGSVSDQDVTDTNQLCIEAQAIGTAFTNTEQSCGSAVAYSGTPVATSHTLSSLLNGTQYHWQARTKDVGGLYSAWVQYGGNKDTVTASPDFGIDTSAPTAGVVRDGPSQGVDAGYNNGALNALSGNWSGFADTSSGILRYEYSIGTTAGGTTVAGWTAVASTTTEVTRSGLSLRTSVPYYFNVRAVDMLGQTSAVVSSNGQFVAPTLSFAVSSNQLTFDRLNSGNSYTSSKTLNTTTSTNAYSGYMIRQYADSLLTDVSKTIPDYSGTWATPTVWSGTGFGFTSNDTTVAGTGDKFAGATKYARFAASGPGDVVADHTNTIVGTPVTNQQFTLTYRVTASATQPTGNYAASFHLGATVAL